MAAFIRIHNRIGGRSIVLNAEQIKEIVEDHSVANRIGATIIMIDGTRCDVAESFDDILDMLSRIGNIVQKPIDVDGLWKRFMSEL